MARYVGDGPGVNDQPVLLDSSIWIRYFRRAGSPDLLSEVQEAITGRRVAICSVVTTELLRGCRDDEAFDSLREMLLGLVQVPVDAGIWEQAARLGYDLRRHGLPLSLPDLVIAQCAISSGRTLWHADRVFERVKQHTPLQTLDWGATS